MTIYDLIRRLADYPSDAEVVIQPMHRKHWYRAKRQEALGVRACSSDIGSQRPPITLVEIYGTTKDDA